MESSTQGQTAPGSAPALGRRIVIWGVTGSGKTILARRLGEILGLGAVDLDAIRHERGWDSVGLEEFRERLTAMLNLYADGWVTAGSYSAISDIYLSRADTLIWLHLPWRVSFWRLLSRTLARAWDKTPLYNENGPRESWRTTFFSPRSILWWSVRYHGRTSRNIRHRSAALRPEVRVIELRTATQVTALLRAAKAQEAERERPAN